MNSIYLDPVIPTKSIVAATIIRYPRIIKIIRFTLAESFGKRLFALITITLTVIRDTCI